MPAGNQRCTPSAWDLSFMALLPLTPPPPPPSQASHCAASTLDPTAAAAAPRRLPRSPFVHPVPTVLPVHAGAAEVRHPLPARRADVRALCVQHRIAAVLAARRDGAQHMRRMGEVVPRSRAACPHHGGPGQERGRWEWPQPMIPVTHTRSRVLTPATRRTLRSCPRDEPSNTSATPPPTLSCSLSLSLRPTPPHPTHPTHTRTRPASLHDGTRLT